MRHDDLKRYFNVLHGSYFQLELITELLGTPSMEDMRFACPGARAHMMRRAPRPPALAALYTLSVQATHEAVHLLAQVHTHLYQNETHGVKKALNT